MTRGSLTRTEAAILLAVVIFTGFMNVSLVLIGYGVGAVAFNVIVSGLSLFLLASDELAPLGDPAEVSQ